MNCRYSNNRKEKSDLDKSKELFGLIDSLHIDNIDYRTILDSAAYYGYGSRNDQYNEKDIIAIMVNNIRHDYSNYESGLKYINRIKRSKTDYAQYKNSILQKIADSYPALKYECEKQKHKVDMVIIKE